MISFNSPFSRWMSRLAILCGIGAIAMMAVVFGGDADRPPMIAMMLPFLLGFAAFKWALAAEARHTLKVGGTAAAELVTKHGTMASLKQWIAYKYAAVITSLVASGFIAAMLLR
jgi:hypothetical protein